MKSGDSLSAVSCSEQKANMLPSIFYGRPLMPRNDKRYGRRNAHGRSHGRNVYEAVALGLAAIRGNEWVTGIAEGLNSVQVCAADVPVVHSVQLKDFTAWLERSAGSPKDLSKRKRVKEILGMSRDARTTVR